MNAEMCTSPGDFLRFPLTTELQKLRAEGVPWSIQDRYVQMREDGIPHEEAMYQVARSVDSEALRITEISRRLSVAYPIRASEPSVCCRCGNPLSDGPVCELCIAREE